MHVYRKDELSFGVCSLASVGWEPTAAMFHCGSTLLRNVSLRQRYPINVGWGTISLSFLFFLIQIQLRVEDNLLLQ